LSSSLKSLISLCNISIIGLYPKMNFKKFKILFRNYVLTFHWSLQQ
jgi:hypothetical protein